MQLEPALLDSALDAGAELCPACVKRVEEWVVDLLNVDAAVLYRLDSRSQLNELTGGASGLAKGRSVTCFIAGIKTSSPCLA
ncbi:hypothetical protein [Bradyrhizobium canariense]|uniref:hypothetical protein n=1 Tax=Bradyrhizobium canariense TaxID=255045 RepID=UPI00130217CB